MLDSSGDSSGSSSIPESQAALIHLHKAAGAFKDIDPGHLPGFRPIPLDAALRTVAESPVKEVSTSARLAVLHDLIHAPDPKVRDQAGEGIHVLAESVAKVHGLDPKSLLEDLETADEQKPFSTSQNGQQLPHHVAAFIGQDVCQTGSVQVDGLPATWIFSEFETDAPFENVVGWVDPHNWPERGPMLFKQMAPVGGVGPVAIGTLGSDHWHGLFHEEVQLVSVVNTYLHCDFWRDGDNSAGMTYALNLSLDNEINVDRGFLSVNELGSVRRVKALKIVGFTNTIWNEVAKTVCPTWTDFVRAAVEGGSTSTPQPPPAGPAGPSDLFGDLFEAWTEFVGKSGRAYVDLFGDTFSRVTAGGYKAADWVEDGTKIWSQLARDWAKAWAFGLDLIDDVSDQGLDASFMPPTEEKEKGAGMATAMSTSAAGTSTATSTGESTLIPLPNLPPGEVPKCTDLQPIEANGRALRENQIVLTRESLADGTPAVRIRAAIDATPGLYVGELTTAKGKKLAAAQLYISGARRPSGT